MSEPLDSEKAIVAYNAQGKPLTRLDYQREIDEAINKAERGRVISQEDIEKDFI